MIIGFSGKIGHGKDMAAEMVQYIQYQKLHEGVHDWVSMDFTTFEILPADRKELYSRCQIEKFGGKLKDIVCLLLNCTREQLEDRDFKEKELGEEWDRYRLESLYLPETMDSECGEYYEETHYFSTKKEAKEWGAHIKNQLDVSDDERRYGMSAEYSYEIEKEKLTPRLLLQLMGTECGREILHPNIWVNATLADYSTIYNFQRMDTDKDKYPSWVISDVRFPNEIKGIEKYGGIVIRIERDSVPVPENEHVSETALDNYPFEYVIKNNGTKEELLEKIKKIIENKFGKSK